MGGGHAGDRSRKTIMKVVFRVDSSLEIGSGHVLRCLTLADRLRENGDSCQFICREHLGHLASLIKDKGFHVDLLSPPVKAEYSESKDLPEHASWLGVDWETDAFDTKEVILGSDVDWLVVDHYGLDHRWQRLLAGIVKKLMIIDDLADRVHDCDLLLDQTYGRVDVDYQSLIPFGSTSLLGADYILLRPEFNQIRNQALLKRQKADFNCLLISLGGGDKNNLAGEILASLSPDSLPNNIEITLVLGWGAPWLEQVREQAARLPWNITVHEVVNNMAQLMLDSDWAIGAAGGTSWERACLGLPAVLIVIAENQRLLAKQLQNSGAVKVVHMDELASPVILVNSIKCLLRDYDDMVQNCASICDGLGVARVERKMRLVLDIELRNATLGDCRLIYTWQLQPQVRLFARNKSIPTWEEHSSWFETKLEEQESNFYIIEESSTPVGVVRLDPNEQTSQFEISIYLSEGADGRGIASHALALARKAHPELDLLAVVLKGNEASHKLFNRAGYQKISEDSYLNAGKYKKSNNV